MNDNEFELILRARDEFSAAFDRAQQDMREIQAAMTALETTGKRQGAMVTTLRAQYGALRAEWASDTVMAQRLNATLGKTARTPLQLPLAGMSGLRRAAATVQQIGVSAQRAAPSVAQLGAAVNTVSGAAAAATPALAGVQSNMFAMMAASTATAVAVTRTAGALGATGASAAAIYPQLTRLRRMLRWVSAGFNQVTASATRAGAATQGMGIKTKFTWFQMLRLGAAIGGMQLGISVLATTVIGLRNAVIGFNRDLETATLQFTTLTGSVKFAEFHLKQLLDFASRTPFTFAELTDSSRQLEVFGGAALNNLENIELLGNTAAATQKDLSNITFWVARFYGALKGSRPLGEMLTRFQELGIVSTEFRGEIEKMAEEGAPLEEMWQRLRTELKKNDGAMLAMSDSWVGLTSTMKDNASRLIGTAFTPLFESIKNGFRSLNDVITSTEAEAAIARFSAKLQRGLDSVIRWFREDFPTIIRAFVSVWETLYPPARAWFILIGGLYLAFASLAYWITQNELALKIIIGLFVSMRIGALVTGIYAMATAWWAAQVGATAFAVAIGLIRAALITTGIGILLVALGLAVLWVSENWVLTQNVMRLAANAMIIGVEFMVNQILKGLNWLVKKGAEYLGTFIGWVTKLPTWMLPFDQQLNNLATSLTGFADNEAWEVTLGRLGYIKEAVEDVSQALDAEDPFAGLGEDLERAFAELEGSYGDESKKIKTDLELALESIGKQIQDEITKAYIEGGVAQAEAVRAQQLALLEESWETARALEDLFGHDLAQALLTTFNQLKQSADDVNVSPLLIALAAIKGRNSDLGRDRITKDAAVAGSEGIRFGPTYIDTVTITTPRPQDVKLESLSKAVSEGIKRGSFSKVGLT